MLANLALAGFLLVAAGVAVSMLLAARLLRVRARARSPLAKEPYECGELPEAPAWVRFHARYYVIALFFVVFDIEAAFLIPWGVAVRRLGTTGLVAVLSFLGVLLLAWIWGIRKGALEWQ